jgi:hypothetical protein
MPIETLAALLVSSVLMPIAKKGMESLESELGDRIGKAGAEKTTGILGKIRDRVRAMFTSDDDRATLKSFEKFPDSMRQPLEAELATKLADDPAAASQLQSLLDERLAETGGMSIGRIMADTVGIVDFRGGTISGGIVAGVVINAPRPETGTAGPPRSSQR